MWQESSAIVPCSGVPLRDSNTTDGEVSALRSGEFVTFLFTGWGCPPGGRHASADRTVPINGSLQMQTSTDFMGRSEIVEESIANPFGDQDPDILDGKVLARLVDEDIG